MKQQLRGNPSQAIPPRAVTTASATPKEIPRFHSSMQFTNAELSTTEKYLDDIEAAASRLFGYCNNPVESPCPFEDTAEGQLRLIGFRVQTVRQRVASLAEAFGAIV